MTMKFMTFKNYLKVFFVTSIFSRSFKININDWFYVFVKNAKLRNRECERNKLKLQVSQNLLINYSRRTKNTVIREQQNVSRVMLWASWYHL